MTRIVAALASGCLFGFGLALSGMANPAKVLAFLDVAGNWDASLAFVMAGALAVAAPGFRLAAKRPKPLFAAAFPAPVAPRFDWRLIGGSAAFGLGWGLIGFCPGPAFAALAYRPWPAVLVVAAIAAGAVLADRVLPAKT